MRAVSSLFGRNKGRSNASDRSTESAQPEAKKGATVFGTLSRKISSRNESTPILVPSEFGGASTSSSGSSHPRTPDDHELPSGSTASKRWTWRGSKKAALPSRPNAPTELWDASQAIYEQPTSMYESPTTAKPSEIEDSSEDENVSSSESEDDDPGIHISRPMEAPVTLEGATNRLRLLTQDGLRPPFSPPPLLHLPGSALYPRSVNIPGALSRMPTLESNMMKSRLLQSLRNGRFPSDREGSSTFYAPQSSHRSTPRPSLVMDDVAVSPPAQILSCSQGLACWRSRGFFEERVSVWTEAESGGLICSIVTGTKFGVEALEVSAHLEALAGDDSEETNGVAIGQSANLSSGSSSSLNVGSSSVATRNAPSLPSPLRNQHAPSSPPSIAAHMLEISIPTTESLMPPSFVVTAPSPAPKPRGVRFLEEEKDDSSVLHVTRSQKRKAQKAQTLQEERDRRAFEALRAAQQAERQKREAERLEWEREKAVWEQERRAMEEEKRQKAYAKEVAAARARREASRTGSLGRPGMRETISARSYHDPPSTPYARRQASDPNFPATRHAASSYSPGSSGSPSPADGSPMNSDDRSRPNSIASARTSVSSFSDAHGIAESSKRRSSLPAQMMRNQPPPPPMPQFAMAPMSPMMPMMPYNAFNMQMPAMPYNPYDMTMMPLLPPSPAFMMHQPRQPANPRQASSPRASGSTDRLVSPPTSSGATEKPQRERRDSRASPRNSLTPSNHSSGDLRARPADRRSGSSGDIHARAGDRRSGGSADSHSRPTGDRRSGSSYDSHSRPLDRRSGSSGDLPARKSVHSSTWPTPQPKPTYLTPWQVQSQLQQQQQQQQAARGRPMPRRQSVVT